MLKKSLTTLESLRARREEIYKIADKYCVSNIRVFGSVARGEDKKNSDIDLLVNIDYKSYGSGFARISFKYEIEKFLHKKTDVISEDGVSKFLKDRIFNEAVAI
ncbi:MAG: nucleotidyltransferase domain-containing protein [Pseudomonadota bacterium]